MTAVAPLAGRRILVPLSGAAGARISAEVRARGGDPVVSPLTETAPASDARALLDAAERIARAEYDWIAVTSANGAEALAGALQAHATEALAGALRAHAAPPDSIRIAAVGPATARALESHGLAVDLMPRTEFSGSALAEILVTALDAEARADVRADAPRPRRVLLPLSESADDTLETALRAAGHRPERVGAYRTVAAPRDPAVEAEVAAGRIDALLVLSGSAAHEVSERFAPIPPRTRLAAIGGPTARALASHGLRAAVVSAVHTVPGLLDALGEALSAPTEGAHA